MGRSWEEALPAIAMVGLQFVYAIQALMNRAALVKGMSPTVFMVYRQAIATLVLSPFALLFRKKSSTCSMSVRSFILIFVTAIIGVVVNQTMYYEGLYLATSSTASAMSNLVPAVTFLIAVIIGLEKIDIRSLSTIAKIFGTVVCVTGAVSIALLRGPKLLNVEIPPTKSLLVQLAQGENNWLLGCVCLFANSCSWSLWLILQVPLTACYPDHLSLSAWTCFLSTLQAMTIALFLERNPNAWYLSSFLEITCCLFSGIVGSGIQFVVQSWCISRKGPLFSAMFNPLCTVIVTLLAAIILHEQIYLGSVIGGIAVIIGLYIVLWGKAKEMNRKKLDRDLKSASAKVENFKIDVEQPLLQDKSKDLDAEESL